MGVVNTQMYWHNNATITQFTNVYVLRNKYIYIYCFELYLKEHVVKVKVEFNFFI